MNGNVYAKALVDTLYNGPVDSMVAWANEYFGASYASIDELVKAKKDKTVPCTKISKYISLNIAFDIKLL